MKTKYAAEAADTFKSVIKINQNKKFGPMMVQSSFLECVENPLRNVKRSVTKNDFR